MVKKISEVMRCVKNEKGVTTMEYALVAGLISIVAIAMITNVGNAVNAAFTAINTALTGI